MSVETPLLRGRYALLLFIRPKTAAQLHCVGPCLAQDQPLQRHLRSQLHLIFHQTPPIESPHFNHAAVGETFRGHVTPPRAPIDPLLLVFSTGLARQLLSNALTKLMYHPQFHSQARRVAGAACLVLPPSTELRGGLRPCGFDLLNAAQQLWGSPVLQVTSTMLRQPISRQVAANRRPRKPMLESGSESRPTPCVMSGHRRPRTRYQSCVQSIAPTIKNTPHQNSSSLRALRWSGRR